MAADLEQTGVQLTAQDAQQFLATMKQANDAVASFADAATKAAKKVDDAGKTKGLENLEKGAKKAESSFGDLLKAASNLPVIGSGASQAASAVQGLGQAGAAAGALMSAALGPVVLVIAAITAAIAAAVIAFKGIDSAVNNLANYANSISDIQKVTGVTAGLAQEMNASARIAGVSVDTVTMSFQQLNNGAIEATEAAAEGLKKAGGAADDTAKQLDRLNTDHMARLAEMAESQSKRIDDINKQMAEAAATLNQQQAERAAEYDRQIEEGRRQLNERLADMEKAHAREIADITASLVDEAKEYTKRRAESEADLTDKLAKLNEDARADIAEAERKGAEGQTQLQEDLQKDLAAIEQKYSDKRQSIQEKLYDPNTNPLLRTFYRSQLNSLDKQEKAEKDSAQVKYNTEAQRLRAETELAVKAINDRVAKEDAILRAASAKQLAELGEDHAKRTAALQQRLDRENEQYSEQTERLKVENARREADLRRTFDKQTTDAAAAYDRQVAKAQESQAEILAETQKRIDAENLQYARQLEDINARTASAMAEIAGATNPAAEALKDLGISLEEWNKLTDDEKVLRLRDALASIEDPAKKLKILSDVMGPRRAAEMLNFFEVFSAPHPLGLELTQAELDELEQFKRDQREIDLQFELLGAQIGKVFFPIWRDLLLVLKQFWAEHGPEITRIVQAIATFFATNLRNSVVATVDLWNNSLKPAFNAVWTFLSQKLYPIFKSINDFLVGAFKTGLGIVILALDALRKALEPVWTWLDKTFQKIVKDLQPALTWLKDKVLTPLGKIFDDVGAAVGRFFSGLTNEFQRIQQSFPPWLKKLLGIETVEFNSNVSYTGWQGYAGGGIMPAGQPAWVGEYGKELVWPLVDSYVMPMQDMMGGRVSPPASAAQITNASAAYDYSTHASNTAYVTVNVSGNASPAQTGDAVVAALARAGYVVVN